MANAHRWLGAVIYRSLRQGPGEGGLPSGEFWRLRDVLTSGKKDVSQRAHRSGILGPKCRMKTLATSGCSKERPDPINPRKKSGQDVYHRRRGCRGSGTSLMMQMLEAGGLPPKTDGERKADPDNPRPAITNGKRSRRVGKEPTVLDEGWP